MNVMPENQKNMRAWFYARHPRIAHVQHAPGSLCRTRKETLFPDIFESGKLRFKEVLYVCRTDLIISSNRYYFYQTPLFSLQTHTNFPGASIFSSN